MKAIDIALKDLHHSFRSAFALVFSFVIPLLMVGLFYFAFGGMLSGDEGEFELPTTRVEVVNLDEPEMGGQLLVDTLQNEGLAQILDVTIADDADSARAAVDAQEASVAVIIPADFTAALYDPEGRAAVELYQDPTLTLGPGIVRNIINQIIDGFAGARIATGVTYNQLSTRHMAIDPNTLQQVGMQYGEWAAGVGVDQPDSPWLAVRSTADEEAEQDSWIAQMLNVIMAGMMIFYVFFTAANSSQSILQEEEAGTLPRLFTTPTQQSAVLGGKLLATFVTVVAQVVVLIAFSWLVFGTEWGHLLPIALTTLGMTITAASFGMLVTSILKNTRQAGAVTGGIITITGLVGISTMFTSFMPGASAASGVTNIISLFTPQGWAMRAWSQVMDGQGVMDVLPSVLVMLVFGGILFAIGVYRFNKRFA